jgi:hypothetical protein
MTVSLIILSPLLLLVMYAIGVQYKRDGWWLLLMPVYLAGWPLDVLLNFTLFALIFWDWPKWGEWTLSKRLTRVNKTTGWRGRFARRVTRLLDALDPTGLHVRP